MIGLVFIPIIVEGVVIAATAGLALYAYWAFMNRTDFEKFDKLNFGHDGQGSVTWNGNFFTLPPEYRTWPKNQRYQWYLDNVPKVFWHKKDLWWKHIWSFIQNFWWLLAILIIALRYVKK